jgi:outer membrane immunogenic protein
MNIRNARKAAVALSLMVCASGAVMTQDTPQNPWKGFYIGVNYGNIRAKSDVMTKTAVTPAGYFYTAAAASINAEGAGRLKVSGSATGATLGYNWQYDNLVVGLEGDYQQFSRSTSRSVTTVYPGVYAPATYTVWQQAELSHLASLRARGGWASPHWLIYGTLGTANTRLNYLERFTDTHAAGHESAEQSGTMGGLVWGAGVEGRWAKHWSIKGEWLRAHFGKMSGPGGMQTAVSGGMTFNYDNPWSHSADLSLDALRIGLNFRF